MTLREHIEAILDRPFDDPAWNKLALQHAVAALAILDDAILANSSVLPEPYRLVPDPEPS